MTQDYLIGTRLDEYRLESLLGRGGMARVYRALDVNLNRPTALKVIDLPHRAEEEYIQRFRREAQAIAQLDHPHIVRLYRFGEAQAPISGDSILYMAMQYIEGADLRFVLDSYRKDGMLVECSEVARVIREVCDALDYAHKNGVIHRDVKPSNILLDAQGRAILTDFGLAMLSTQATRGEIFGSPHYIAPEQAASSARAVPQSDLYSAGVILYEMLTGALPFTAAEPLELAMMHVNNPPPPPSSLRPEIGPELEAVILKALAKSPAGRFPSGHALANALDLALKSSDSAALDGCAPQATGTIARRAAGAADPGSTVRAVEARAITSAHPEQPAAQEPAATRRAIPPTILAADAQAAQPAAPKRRSTLATLAVILAGALLLFIACLSGGGLLLYNQFLKPSGAIGAGSPTDALPVPIATTAATRSVPTQRDLPTATSPSGGVAPAQPRVYSFEIRRKGEDKGYLVLANTGAGDLPLARISVRAGKGTLEGAMWDVGSLRPGECVVALKADRKKDSQPPETTGCTEVVETAPLEKKQEDVFKGAAGIFFGERQVGECEKDQQVCAVGFQE